MEESDGGNEEDAVPNLNIISSIPASLPIKADLFVWAIGRGGDGQERTATAHLSVPLDNWFWIPSGQAREYNDFTLLSNYLGWEIGNGRPPKLFRILKIHKCK